MKTNYALKARNIFYQSLMLMLYAVAAICLYWYFLDRQPPVHVNYEAPFFSSRIVTNNDDAQKYRIDEAREGDIVYRFTDYCVDRERPGVMQKYWTDGLVYFSPSTSTIGLMGCYKRSFAETVPPVPGHKVFFDWKVDYQINPVYVYRHQTPVKIPLMVLPK